MLRGYAVKIELIRWEKRHDKPAAFETILSHYAGGLLEQRAESCYLILKKELEAQAKGRTQVQMIPRRKRQGIEQRRQ